MKGIIEKTLKEWEAEGKNLFGEKAHHWKFVCPTCGYVHCGQDFIDVGLKPEEALSMAGFSCIGRVLPKCRDAFGEGPGPCNYSGGGLFRLNPVKITDENGKSEYYFDFYRGEK